jgi:hypothetical protein
MGEMAKLTVNWTGFVGAPGYTNLYFRDFQFENAIDQAIVDGAITKTDTWLNAFNAYLPGSVNVTIASAVEVIEDTTGNLLRYMQGTPFARGNGSGTGAYSAASGACVNWYTNTIVRNRRLRGRSFMVPLAGSALDTAGTIDNAAVVSMRNASTAMAGGVGVGDLGVWSRPTPILDANGDPTGEYNPDGQWAFVTSATVPDKCAVLRSRRD